MNIFLCSLFFAAGIATNAAYNRIKRISEEQAYRNGYRQAQKEEQMRIDASKKGRYQAWYTTSAQQPERKTTSEPAIPECFVKEFEKNKRAIALIK